MLYTQQDRFLTIDTPLGEDTLLITAFKGKEGISELFCFKLDLLSEDHSINFKDIIGQNATVSITLTDDTKRYFNGIISCFTQKAGEAEAEVGRRFAYYTATLVPWPWLLTRTLNSRIFQNLSVPQIVEKIFVEKGFQSYKLQLNDAYEPREYCVQYRETDFNFFSRLLEDEGIFYFFEHENSKHTLVLTDSSSILEACPKQECVRYQISSSSLLEEDVVTQWECRQEMQPGVCEYALNDYDFQEPKANLSVRACGKEDFKFEKKEICKIYDYPGAYTKRKAGDRLTRIRIEEQEAKIITIKGASNCRAFTSGYRFDLTDYYREDMNNQSYVLTCIEHEMAQPFETAFAMTASDVSYKNRFTCIPITVPYRPARKTTKPLMQGTQTAIVVGPEGEHIHTDAYGRVKVQFHWDREGKCDDNSSCWIRVSQGWAGQGWGAMHIPHVGHEVIVDFLEGDPDRPIITGRVYHGTNLPHHSLPDQKTKSVIRDDFGNEIVFDATPGQEHMRLYSPHHKSGIEIGKSFQNWTGSDNCTYYKGNRVTAGLGDKVTLQGGYDVKGTIGTAFTALAGLKWDLGWAANLSHNFGFSANWNRGSVSQKSNKDMLFASKEDCIIGAGDEFCLAAGTKEPDAGNKNKTVIRATPDGVTLGLGEDLTETGEGIGEGNWYKKEAPFAWERDVLIPAMVSIGFIINALSDLGTEEVPDGQGKTKEIPKIGAFVGTLAGGSVLQALALVFAWNFYKKNLRDEKIEPVRHVAPPQKIWMHREGTIGIVSTKGGDLNPIDGTKGRIVLGVNQQADGQPPADAAWRYYDTYATVDQLENAKALWERNRKLKYEDRKNLLKAFLSQPLNKTHKKLGEGSNIIVEKNQIRILSGEPGRENLEIMLNNKTAPKGIGLRASKKDQKDKSAEIAILESDGEISLDNQDRDGIIAIRSKNDIELTTKTNIYLDAGSKGEIKIRSKFSSPNFKVLK